MNVTTTTSSPVLPYYDFVFGGRLTRSSSEAQYISLALTPWTECESSTSL